MADSPSQEEVVRVEIVTLGLVQGDPAANLDSEFGHNHLVGIND